MKTLSRAILGLSLVLLTTTPVFATSFTLNQSTCCGIGPFGTVTLTTVDSDTVDVLVSLKPGIGFVDTGTAAPGNHPDFAWTLDSNIGSGTGAISIHYVQVGGDGWTLYNQRTSPITMSDGFGAYQFALYCNGAEACGPGASHPNFGPLQFQLTRNGGLTVDSFIANAEGTFFAADIINGAPNGNTGLVRTTAKDRDITVTAVPEPATLTLVGLGVIGVTRRLRRKREA
jgi:hypothetical protein